LTQYERGTKLERDLQHYWEYNGHYAMRSAGSHGHADVIVIGNAWVWGVQCKLHDKLRDEIREKEFKQIQRPSCFIPCSAWYQKIGKRRFIMMKNLLSKDTPMAIEPLNLEQEKKYQEMKKAKIEARKSTGVRVLSGVRPTKTRKGSKS
jgi:Holliday junction resolvase